MQQISTLTKLNPLWWFGNADDPVPPADYMAGKPNWLRNLAWALRNPAHNLTNYVLGVGDRDFTVSSTQVGNLQLNTINVGAIKLPGLRYQDKNITAYLGWQPDGKLGAKFNINNSKIQGV